MSEINVKKVVDVRRFVTQAIKATPNSQLPQVILYDEGLESPVYKVTVEVIEKEHFIDAKGVKWVKEKV